MEKESWIEKVSQNMFIRISSKDGHEGICNIGSMSTIVNGTTINLINKELSLSTNTGGGDKTAESSIVITKPTNSSKDGKIYSKGNAQIIGTNCLLLKISLSEACKTVSSSSGLRASIFIKQSLVYQVNCFQILIGKKGIPDIDKDGNKIRPHITILPNGSWCNLSERKYRVSIENHLNHKEEIIFPEKIIIFLNEYSENLVLYFGFLPEKNEVCLINAEFESICT